MRGTLILFLFIKLSDLQLRMIFYFEVVLQLVLQMKKIFSEGTDVAGTANTRFAITDNRGYLDERGFF